ncbi:tRNA pseudouridine(38-40) synthase TruA [Alphaproteobacteria bacterium KMM 3653]|uniref:tRNA pseudouridine synthase A n=1 Tax=Harenicola maris TaxID=2841044 RepID=A0AAP2CS99_9RHOB|nr:tRNA pseudouridine(38-40) synthase TruA [Harenicola maris]
MPRYALQIEYNGQPFCGWQRQTDLPTVQGAVEDALKRLEPEAPGIGAAGRTDTGVHALAQVAHCDMAKAWDPFRLNEALNYHLKPLPVSIIDVKEVDPEWHARFSAHERRYLFRLIARRAPLTHDAGLAWQVAHPLQLQPMQEAAKALIGTHDFTTFRASECQAASPVKSLDQAEITEQPYPGGVEYRFRFRARSFLHNQVRSMVGSLERVGAGKWTPSRFAEALAAADRSACGPVCPPQGLYLAGVGYQDDPFAG